MGIHAMVIKEYAAAYTKLWTPSFILRHIYGLALAEILLYQSVTYWVDIFFV